MSTSEKLFSDVLKKNHKSVTASRQIIFQALQDHDAISMGKLVKKCDSRVDRASIYRTITLFETLGIVQRLQLGWKYKLELCDEFSDHHHHMTCVKCGKIYTFNEDRALENRLQFLVKQNGFQSQVHQIEIRGLCAHCQS